MASLKGEKRRKKRKSPPVNKKHEHKTVEWQNFYQLVEEKLKKRE